MSELKFKVCSITLSANSNEVALIPSLFSLIRQEAKSIGFDTIENVECELILTLETPKLPKDQPIEKLERELLAKLQDQFLDVHKLKSASSDWLG